MSGNLLRLDFSSRRTDPRVSIVTPIWNAAPFLEEAIASVLQQDFEDWEMLLVDDGSTDSSADIAHKWRRRDARFQVLQHPGGGNRGSSASRNLAIQESSGELIALLDADDVWLPGKLRFQIEVLDQHPEAALTFSATERWWSWDPDSAQRDFIVPSAIPRFGSDALIPPPELLKAFLWDEALTPCTCSTVFRRRVFPRGDEAFLPQFPGLYDDQVFLAKICLAEPVYSTSECLARYRKHPQSCCAVASQNGTEAAERNRFLKWLVDYQPACASLL